MTWPRIDFLSHYVSTAPTNKVNDFLVNSMRRRGQVPDLFTPDGFVAGQMIVRALDVANGDNVDRMISALEGWNFVGPKGVQSIRKADYAVISRCSRMKLVGRERQVAAACVVSGSRARSSPPAAKTSASRPSGIVAASAPILATRNLGLDIGGAHIVADVALGEVRAGEFIGIIGPNGAGKTTLFNLLSGLMRPTTGGVELTVATSRACRLPAHARRPRPHVPGLERLPAPVGARERAAGRGGRSGGLAADLAEGALGAGGDGAGDRRSRPRRARSPAAWPAGLLSHGDKRKLELAMLLAGDPDVILLDEPMAGVSAEDVDELVELIGSVHREEGKTVLMVEHRMEVVIGLAEKIAVMHHGACSPSTSRPR